MNSDHSATSTTDANARRTAVRRRALSIAAVLLASVLPYLNCLENDFVWDDRPLILQNYRIRSPLYIGEIFTRDFFDHVDEEIKYGYYRPLVSLSYMLDSRIGGRDAFWFHLANVLFHAANSVLILLLARRVLRGRSGAALAAALVFAVHPVHTESVAWIAGRTDLLAALFMLASILSLDSRLRAGRGGAPALSLFLFAAALLSKETAVVFPAVVAVFLVSFHARSGPRRMVVLAAEYVLVLALYLLVRFVIAAVHAGPASDYTLPVHLYSLLGTFLLYARLLAVPVGLSAYITNPLAASVLDPRVLGGAALLIALCLAAARAWRRDRPLAFFIACGLLSLLPLANVVRISAPGDMGFPAAERFLYMPSAFFIAAAVAATATAVKRRAAAVALLITIVVVFAILTAKRNRAWRDEEALFTDAFLSSPGAPLLWNNLGVHYSRAGRHGEAVRCIEKAIELEERSPRLLTNLAAAKRRMGRSDEAIALLEEALARGGKYASIHYNLGLALDAKGDREGAVRELERALSLDPRDLEAMADLGELYKKSGRYGAAEAYYLRALALCPSDPALWSNLGVVYRLCGKDGEAERAFRRSIALDALASAARANLGALLAKTGRFGEADAELSAALALDPGSLDAANALGALRARVGRTAEAGKIFEDLIAKHPGDKEAYLNLGILRHGQGRTDEAAFLFGRALELDPGDARARSYAAQLGGPAGRRGD